MTKANIVISKIFHNTTKTGKEKFTLMCDTDRGRVGFGGWGTGEEFHEGQQVEIAYDESSKYQGKTAVYYNLIQPHQKDTHKFEEAVLRQLGEIHTLLEAVNYKVSTDQNSIPQSYKPFKPPVKPQATSKPLGTQTDDEGDFDPFRHVG